MRQVLVDPPEGIGDTAKLREPRKAGKYQGTARKRVLAQSNHLRYGNNLSGCVLIRQNKIGNPQPSPFEKWGRFNDYTVVGLPHGRLKV